jgi:hypothetical protein
MDLDTINKNAYILFFEYDNTIQDLLKREYKHLYCVSTDKKIYDSPNYTQIKYLWTSNLVSTHFPDSFFDVVINSHSDKEGERITRNGGFYTDKHGVKHIVKKKEGKILPKDINVILSTLGKFEGIAHTTENMKKNLLEYGVQAHLYKKLEDADNKNVTIVEWEPFLYPEIPKDRHAIIELHTYPSSFKVSSKSSKLRYYVKSRLEYLKTMDFRSFFLWFVDYIVGKTEIPLDWESSKKELEKHTLLVRNNELAEFSGIKEYYLMPHCIVKNNKIMSKNNNKLFIGTYGFAAPYKNFEAVCEVALKLDIKALLLLSTNSLNSRSVDSTARYATLLYNRYNGRGKITIKLGQFSFDELKKELYDCTHLFAPQHNVYNVSSSMRFMVSLGKPVIATDSMQSREAQVLRVNSLNEITISYLNSTRNIRINQDDGTRYLCKYLQYHVWKYDRK